MFHVTALVLREKLCSDIMHRVYCWSEAEKYPTIVSEDSFGACITRTASMRWCRLRMRRLRARKSTDIHIYMVSSLVLPERVHLGLPGGTRREFQRNIHTPNCLSHDIHGIHCYHEDSLFEECAGFELTRWCVGLLSVATDAGIVNVERIAQEDWTV